MQPRTESTEIGDLRVQCTQFGAMSAFNLLAKISKVAAPALGAVTGADLQGMSPGLVIVDAIASAEPDECTRLVGEILKRTHVTMETPGGPKQIHLTSEGSIDAVFTGRLMDLLKTVRFAVETNYEDFFAAVAAAADEAGLTQAAAAAESTSS